MKVGWRIVFRLLRIKEVGRLECEMVCYSAIRRLGRHKIVICELREVPICEKLIL